MPHISINAGSDNRKHSTNSHTSSHYQTHQRTEVHQVHASPHVSSPLKPNHHDATHHAVHTTHVNHATPIHTVGHEVHTTHSTPVVHTTHANHATHATHATHVAPVVHSTHTTHATHATHATPVVHHDAHQATHTTHATPVVHHHAHQATHTTHATPVVHHAAHTTHVTPVVHHDAHHATHTTHATHATPVVHHAAHTTHVTPVVHATHATHVTPVVHVAHGSHAVHHNTAHGRSSVTPVRIIEKEMNHNHDLHTDIQHTLKLHPDWLDITPAHRHGVEETRISCTTKSSVAHCLVVDHDTTEQTDLAHLEYINLDNLPAIHRKHELYSVCISKNVQEILVVKDAINHPHAVTKILYMADQSMWSEPQVQAVILMMHAKLRPGGLKAGLRNDEHLKQAEVFAEHYCKTTGIERSHLAKVHTSGHEHRISRGELHLIKSQPITKGHVVHTEIRPAHVRRNSQTPILVTDTVVLEHGGVSNTFIVGPKGTKKPLGAEIGSDDIHVHHEELSAAELKKLEKKQNKELKKQLKAQNKAAKKAEKNAKKEHKYIAKNGHASSTPVHVVSSPASVPHHAHTAPVVHHPDVHHSATTLHPHQTFHTQSSWQSGTMKQSPMVA